MPSTVIVVSDLHINSTVALSPRTFNLDDGGTYRASRTQRWLGDCWKDFWTEKITQYSNKNDKILIINGDMGDTAEKHISYQLVTNNRADIQRLIYETIEPAIDWADRVYIIRGTAAHTGMSSWLEEAIAQDIDNVVPNGDVASWWHLRAVCDGVRFDIAHHTNMGRLPHTEKNAANKVAAIILYRYLVDMQQKAPNIAIRSHNHRYADSGNNYDTFVVCTGAWTTATEFVYRIGQENTLADIDAQVFVCDKGEYNHTRIKYDYPELRRLWKLTM